MGSILGLLTGPGKSIIDGVTGLINQFVANPEQKLAAQTALLQMEKDYQEKCMDADTQFAIQQAAVITSEAKSDSMLARNWRPILMLTFTVIVAFNYIIAPLFSVHYLPIPPDMWALLKLGITGYIVGRSAEKVAPTIVTALKS
jgi:hypothetical protein